MKKFIVDFVKSDDFFSGLIAGVAVGVCYLIFTTGNVMLQ